jgi:hypothetical protein
MINDFVGIKSTGDFIKWLVVFLLVLLIYVLVIRFLWNSVLVAHITILRPVKTLLETFLLAIALTLVTGSCNCSPSG